LTAIPILATTESSAQTTDSVVLSLFFRVNEAVVDPSYMNNRARIEAIETDSLTEILSIAVTATSSPEGNRAYNDALAARRGEAIKALLRDRFPEIRPSDIRTSVTTEYWSALRPMLENDRAVPGRGKLLEIIDDPAMQNKERAIRALEGGATYDYLKRHVLVFFRTGEATIALTYRTAAEPEPEPEPTIEPEPVPEPAVEPLPEIVFEITDAKKESCGMMPLALKTNLLFDLVGAANLGVEIPLWERFSVGADAAYSFWRINNLYALQTIQGSVNAKYWFRPWGEPGDRMLTGWNAGVYAMYCTRYDAQWLDGLQGDGFWSAGVSGGYAMPLSDRWRLEAAIAAGYIHTPEVRFYDRPERGHLMWRETRQNVGRVSITKLQFNLVWLLRKGAEK